jgi:hypothetical protein
VAGELPKASKTYAIGFSKLDDEFTPVAIQSLIPGINLYLSTDGKCLNPYIPAVYRSYPFVLANDEDGNHILCADMESGLVGEEGDPIFECGEPSDDIRQMLGYLDALMKEREKTSRTVKVLAKHQLIQPWPLKMRHGEDEQSVVGLYRIDEQALNQLSAEALAEIRDAGGLVTAYCQLLSMQNINNLQTLIQLHEQAAEQKAQDVDIEAVFGGQDDTLKFDF